MQTVRFPLLVRGLLAALALPATLCPVAFGLASADAPGSQLPITLARLVSATAAGATVQGEGTESSGVAAARNLISRENFREFRRAKLGESTEPEVFTLEFHVSTKLTGIAATGDFSVLGGSCAEGHVYAAGDVCSVEMTFTPKGPGHRTGRLTIAHSASALPFVTTTGGEAYGPVVSFIPAQITTMPGTYINGALPAASHGLLLSPQALNVDGGDNLYVADTGNNLIRYGNSTGNLSTLAGGGTEASITYYGIPTGALLNAPSGVAVDSTGNVWFSDTGNAIVRYITVLGALETTMGTGGGTFNCSVPSPCDPYAVKLLPFTTLAFDPSGNLFLNAVYGTAGADPAELYQSTQEFSYLYHSIYDGGTYTSPMAVDQNDNIYYAFEFPEPPGGYSSVCQIRLENYALTVGASGGTDTLIGGSRTCGFSGDGGLATGATISSTVEGLALDAAGNLYFSDGGNNRIRRIDAATGIIHTIAGNGIAGLSGDGGPATSAALDAPYGVTVDSQGRVYATSIIPNTTTGPFPAVIREIGINGQLTFPGQGVGMASVAQTVLVSNTGNQELNFTRFAISSGNTTDFAVDPGTTSCNLTVPLGFGRSCTIGVIFTPTADGERAATLSVLDDTVTGVNKVLLSGFGTMSATLTPASMSFASTVVGVTTAAQTATLTNTGTGALSVGSIGLAGLNASSFLDSTNCGATLPAGASCTISVAFKPAAAGSLTVALNVTDDAGTGQQTVTLVGTGAAATGNPVFSPTSLTFASTAVGSASAAQVVTLSNTGTGALAISSIGLTGLNASSFSDSTNCAATLAAGANCTISVVFTPTAAGSLSTALIVTDNAGSGQQSVALAGMGAATTGNPVLSPASLTFASTPVGSSSAAQSVRLTNSGTGALGLTSISMTGANPTAFPYSSNCTHTVNAGAACIVTVTFKSTAPGTDSATLTFVTAAGTVTAAMSGSGAAPAARPVLSPTPVTFSSQVVETASAAKAFTLTNAGTASMTITSFGFTGANAADFTETHGCGTTLAAGANCTISVVFKPAATGARSATLAVGTSAGITSAVVNGTGAGVASKAKLASMMNPIAKGEMLSLTVQVRAASGSGSGDGTAAMPATGQVELMEGGRLLAEGSLAAEGVTLRVANLTPGLHLLRAVYLGDAHCAGSVSNAINELVSGEIARSGPVKPEPERFR